MVTPAAAKFAAHTNTIAIRNMLSKAQSRVQIFQLLDFTVRY